MKIRNYIGTKKFYGMVLALAVPIIVQNGVTTFVGLLDNLMVGSLGTEAISGVAIVNQLMMVVHLTIFGGVSGISIFGAQFFGNEDIKGLRYTFRFRLMFCVGIFAVSVFILAFFGESLISLFLQENEASTPAQLAETLALSKSYLKIILWSILPFVIMQSFASTLRDMGETVSPMIASTIALFINLILNYLLIFGNLGFPRLGVAGAAIGTVAARHIEMLYLVINTVMKKHKFTFVVGAFRSMYVPVKLMLKMTKTGSPLMINEFLWAFAMTAINWCYSTRGVNALAALNINGTIWNLFSLIMMAIGSAIGIISGQRLGAGRIEEARDNVRKLIALSVVLNAIIGVLLIICAPFIVGLYSISDEARQIAISLSRVAGIMLPVISFVHASYFTIRSGGRTVITFIFDCAFAWLAAFPMAFFLTHFTGLPIVSIYIFVQSCEILKAVIGAIILKSGIWARTVIDRADQSAKAI